jgi:hypothetical protein
MKFVIYFYISFSPSRQETQMNLFVVLSNHGVYHDCMGVFSTRQGAQNFLDTHDIHQGYIQSVEVSGDYSSPNDVYEANSFLKEWKVHTFIGLYATQEEAESVAGKEGLVMPRSLDDV